MGQSKGSGYNQMPNFTPEQMGALQQILQMGGSNSQAAAEGYKQFLPGGGGGQAFTNQANQNFQQQTIPSILNAFGSGNKGGSALNQSLAAGGANMNTDLSALLQQNALGASQGLGQLGNSQQQTGLGANAFQYIQKPPPLWQQLLGPLIGVGGKIGGAFAGRS